MPLLVRGVAESQETGMTLIRALEKVVDNKMVSGPLSKEVKQLVIEMSWGTSFEDALTNFKNRINSPIVNRFCVLGFGSKPIRRNNQKSFYSNCRVYGGNERYRQRNRRPNETLHHSNLRCLCSVYSYSNSAGAFIFCSNVRVLSKYQAIPAIGGVGGLKDFFYQDMLVSALTGGLMAGKIGERRVAGGMKHSILLVVVGYAIFFAGIPPNWM